MKLFRLFMLSGLTFSSALYSIGAHQKSSKEEFMVRYAIQLLLGLSEKNITSIGSQVQARFARRLVLTPKSPDAQSIKHKVEPLTNEDLANMIAMSLMVAGFSIAANNNNVKLVAKDATSAAGAVYIARKLDQAGSVAVHATGLDKALEEYPIVKDLASAAAKVATMKFAEHVVESIRARID